MNIIKYPSRELWPDIIVRPQIDNTKLHATVTNILNEVKAHGDEAVRQFEEQFDHAHLHSLAVTEAEMEEAQSLVTDDLRKSIELAHRNIAKFHEAQQFEGKKIETAEGVWCWQKSVAIEKVGLYIPGGTAPLFSTVLMLATPAKIAGCKQIVLCTPPNREGKVNPAILVAAKIAGVSHVFKVGGVQAIGAMAYGTESVPRVYKIFGPGNQYVMAAKQLVSLHDTAIDMPAGPSEVCIIADETSSPEFVAADLLSQAEHGIDSQVFLITTSGQMLKDVIDQVDVQLKSLPRREIAQQSLANSRFVLVHDKTEAMELSNAYAPEHLIISTSDYETLAQQVVNAGSVFLGRWACESAGDYASGTNHTLPTHQYALAYNGVNLDSFNRKITFQHLSEEGIRSIGHAVVCMAENEQLEAHAQAMRLRMDNLDQNISDRKENNR